MLEDTFLEATVLEFEAGFIEDAEAKALLLRRLDKRIQGDARALPSSAYDVALKVLAQERGAAGLEPLTATVLELDDPTLERAVLVAPGYYTDPQQRMAAFDATLEGTLDPRVAFARIEALMGIHNESRRHDIQARVEAEWARISEIIPRQWRRRMPGLWAGAACTRGEAEGLTNWFTTDAAALAPGHERTLAQTREQIELCAAQHWLEPALASAFGS